MAKTPRPGNENLEGKSQSRRSGNAGRRPGGPRDRHLVPAPSLLVIRRVDRPTRSHRHFRISWGAAICAEGPAGGLAGPPATHSVVQRGTDPPYRIEQVVSSRPSDRNPARRRTGCADSPQCVGSIGWRNETRPILHCPRRTRGGLGPGPSIGVSFRLWWIAETDGNVGGAL